MSRLDRRQFLHRLGAAGAAALTTGLAGCGAQGGDGGGDSDGDDGGDDGDGTSVVEMTDDLVYDPDSVTIEVGTTVVWENTGSVGHTVTAYEEEIPDDAEYFASGGFDSEQAARDSYAVGDPASGDIAGGDSYEHTFDVAGTYEYFCVPHESAGMTGTVEVR